MPKKGPGAQTRYYISNGDKVSSEQRQRNFGKMWFFEWLGISEGRPEWWSTSWLAAKCESQHPIWLQAPKGTPLSVTFIYGQPNHTKREAFWLELKPIAKPIWLCIRDFNQVLFHEDKFSFNTRSIAGANSFFNTLNDLELCELEAKG